MIYYLDVKYTKLTTICICLSHHHILILILKLRVRNLDTMSIPAGIVNKVEDLTDLEFAVLLCLIAKEHCLIDTPASTLDDLANELILVGTLPSEVQHK